MAERLRLAVGLALIGGFWIVLGASIAELFS